MIIFMYTAFPFWFCNANCCTWQWEEGSSYYTQVS